MKLRVALIVDNLSLTDWQKKALEHAADYLDIRLILNCTNTVENRRFGRLFAYYILNIFTLRRVVRRVSCNKYGVEIINFAADYNDANRLWQSIPPHVVEKVKRDKIGAIIKFGMSLLRVDDALSEMVIFSFHHGDPEQYRGRPAGFYELYRNEGRVGIVVQKLSNKLDGGIIFARAYSKTCRYSYRSTAHSFYYLSQFMLRKAIINYLLNEYYETEKIGHNYRLPSNSMVCKFIGKLAYRSMLRLLYGAFVEKRWNVVKHNVDDIDSLYALAARQGDVPVVKRGYVSYADPFFSAAGDKVRAEAINTMTGLGEIVELDANNLEYVRTLLKGKHYSYPYSIEEANEEYVMPEVASHSRPFLLGKPFDGSSKMFLLGLEDIRISDGTAFKNDGVYYLFGGLKGSSLDCLYLYFSDNLQGPYRSHPFNPIVIDPGSARMAGRILRRGETLYRLGQNNCYNYGNGIAVSVIEKLSKERYSERLVGRIAFTDAQGPHTLDVSGRSAILDFYFESVSFVAAYRRIASKVLRAWTYNQKLH